MERKKIKRTPLWMLPNGAFVRTEDPVPEGSVMVEEPELPEEPEVKVEDQTAAVLAAMRLGKDD
jgi:hypothetical protein